MYDENTIWLKVVFIAVFLGGHCQSLAPEYEKAATNLKGIVKVGGINCDEDQELAGRFGIKGNHIDFVPIHILRCSSLRLPNYQGVRVGSGSEEESSRLPRRSNCSGNRNV